MGFILSFKWRKLSVSSLSLLIAVIIIVGFFIFKNSESSELSARANELESISKLKINQISLWYEDEIEDASIISVSEVLYSLIDKALIDPDNRNSANLIKHLRSVKSEHRYSNVLITSIEGEVLFSSEVENIKQSPFVIKKIKESLSLNKLIVSDLYRANANQSYIDFISPISVNTKTVFFILRIDAGNFLLPVLSFNPFYEKSSETLLLRVKGDSAILLTDLRFDSANKIKTGALSSFNSIINKNNDQINEVIFSGVDYSNNKVLAYKKTIPFTRWTLISKVDQWELLGTFYKHAILLFIMAIMIIAIAIISVSFLYSKKGQAEERKRQEELAESEEKYYRMFAESPQPMWIYDLETLAFLEVNESAIMHYGYNRNEFLSMTLKDIRPPEDIPKLLDDVVATVDAYNSAGIWRHLKKNGEIVYVSIKSHEVVYNKRVARHVLAHDITDIKIAQIALQDSEMKFRNLFENHSAVKLILDPGTGDIADANDAAVKFYGWTKDELINMNIDQINTLPKAQIHVQMKSIKEGKNNHFEFTHRKSDGSTCDVEVFSSNIVISDKEYIHSIIHDVTEKKKAEQQVAKMMAELLSAKLKAEESDHLKSAFLANMSHEIRTPMNGILGFMDLLQQPGLSGDQRDEYINIVKTSGERLLTTINDIIDISKIQSGQSNLTETLVDVNHLIVNQYNFFKPEADYKGLIFEVISLLPDEKRFISVDSNKLESALTNLIKNALKFTKQGSIKIGCRINENEIEFSVMDTGKGIPADRLSSIFERFIQADTSIVRDHEGSGLGLAISKAYIEMMGGRINVISAPGSGSNFTFYIPFHNIPTLKNLVNNITADATQIDMNNITKDATRETIYADKNLVDTNIINALTTKVYMDNIPTSATQEEFKPDLGDRTILIAEDDEISYIYLSRMMSKYKINLIRAYNGEEAVKICRDNPLLSLVLMDIKMPILDGYQATKQILEFNKDLPIVALTAFAFSDDREKAISHGCVDYLSKPVKKDTLMEVIWKYSKKD